jgi:hypothetical protein
MAKQRDPESCPACGGPLAQGFLLDHANANRREVTQWVAGAPELGWFFGAAVKGRTVLPVVANRCGDCGRLDLVARKGP